MTWLGLGVAFLVMLVGTVVSIAVSVWVERPEVEVLHECPVCHADGTSPGIDMAGTSCPRCDGEGHVTP